MSIKVDYASYHYKNSSQYPLWEVFAHINNVKLSAVVDPSGSGKPALFSLSRNVEH